MGEIQIGIEVLVGITVYVDISNWEQNTCPKLNCQDSVTIDQIH